MHVRALKMQHPGGATEIEKTKLQPIIGGNWKSIEYKSAAAKPDLSVKPSDDARPGTLGNSSFGIPSHSICPSRVDPATCSSNGETHAEEPTRRVTRSATSVSRAAFTSAALSARPDYKAMYNVRIPRTVSTRCSNELQLPRH